MPINTITKEQIEVSYNGVRQQISSGTSLAEAVALWGYGDKKIASAINGDFIARSQYATTLLNAQDTIDIVSPVGGG